MEKNKLFIIGNGFDRAHDLPTSYSDYRDYLEAHYPKFLFQIENSYGIADTDIMWWRYFEENLGYGEYFETEFENIGINTINEMIDSEGNPMPDIEETLSEHFKSYYDYMEQLNQTVLEWAKSIDIESLHRLTNRINNIDSLCFTFNYTNVLEHIYGMDSENVFHVHGSVSENFSKMGHGNYERINFYKNKSIHMKAELNKNYAEIYNGIYKFYQNSLKPVDQILTENKRIFNSYKDVNSVHICGHSLGDVDLPYFKKIKDSISEHAEWFYYFYNDRDNDEVRNKLSDLDINTRNIHLIESNEFFNIEE